MTWLYRRAGARSTGPASGIRIPSVFHAESLAGHDHDAPC